MSEASHHNHRYDSLDCSHLGPDEVQKSLRELFQVLYNAQDGQISDLFLNIRNGASLEEIRSHISEIWGSITSPGGKDSTIAAEMKKLP
jgi:hypothetical protein